MDRLTTNELLQQLANPDINLVDVRPVEAYNGWKSEGEARGGHIDKARSLPHKWIKYIDWLDIVESKGIGPDSPVIVYGDEAKKTEQVAGHFKRAGFKKIGVYHEFVQEWSTGPRRPLSFLPRYRQLVSAEWVDKLIRTGQTDEYENDKFVICHAHYQNRSAYDEGHIPGAVELDTNILESEQTWNLRTPGEIKAALENLGITHDTTVILYGRFSFPSNDDPFPGSSAGHLGAMRCAFIMLVAGVRDVRILNGGLQAWLDAGFETSTAETPKQPVDGFGTVIPQHPELVTDTTGAKKLLKSTDGNLVSVRSRDEYTGKVSGYHYIEKTGRIPGAVFGNCGSDAYHMENYRNPDHTTREYHEIARLWAEAGITPDKHNAFYCGTGWRGSEAFLNAWLMGWPRISVYDGGWFEWSADPANPVATGNP